MTRGLERVRMAALLAALLATPLVVGCGETPSLETVASGGADSQPVEVESLLGRRLGPPALPEDFRRRQEDLLAASRAEYDMNRDDLEALIWIGRRTAYLGRYREAIEIYGEGIETAPDSAKLYRHRGHRYITTRQLDLAVADLERAAELVRGEPDEIEPDGLPNELGIPTSTLQSNIWYHLGLAYYLKGDFENALRAYRECLAVSRNPDMLVATSHWLYMTLRRLGLEAEAEEVLAPIEPDMDVIENHDYLSLLLMYKGQSTPGDVLRAARGEGGMGVATVGYGVGCWYLYNGRPDRAIAIFREIVEGDLWAAFGFIAAEAELARLQTA